MKKTHTKSPTAQIRISIIADPQLVRESLAVLIESNKDLKVLCSIGFTLECSEFKTFGDSEIAVIYFEAGDPIEIVGEIHSKYPKVKIVAITDGNNLDCSTQALKFGAVGVVQSIQSSKLLFEAIRQAHKGETWLNQELLSNLLENGNGSSRAKINGKIGPANDSLTRREIEVVSMIGKGLKSKIIAERLSISEATVRHHLSSIYGKLGVDDRLNLVIYAFERGLVQFSDETRTN